MTYTIQQVFKSVERLGGAGAVAINEPANAITEAGISKETKERLGGIEPAALISSLRTNAKWDSIRETRDMKLAACDWTQVGDAISVGTSSNALKAISTTALKHLCVRATGNGADLTVIVYAEQV